MPRVPPKPTAEDPLEDDDLFAPDAEVDLPEEREGEDDLADLDLGDEAAPEDGEDPLSRWPEESPDEPAAPWELEPEPAPDADEGGASLPDEDGLDPLDDGGLDARPLLEGEDELWATLQDESLSLPPGLLMVGWQEHVHLPDLGARALRAVFDTGEAGSRLHGAVTRLAPGRIRLALGDQALELSASPGVDGTWRATTTVALAGVQRALVFSICEGPGDAPVILGRDALDGYFVVDVSRSFLHRVEETRAWRT